MTRKQVVETTPVATRITKHMRDTIAELLAANEHINMADYVRDLIRKDLEARNVRCQKGDGNLTLDSHGC